LPNAVDLVGPGFQVLEFLRLLGRDGFLPLGMLPQSQRQLGQHVIIAAAVGIIDQFRHPAVQCTGQTAAGVVRGQEATLPQVHEQRIVAVGSALLLAVGLGLGGLALGALGLGRSLPGVFLLQRSFWADREVRCVR
jgi:hypothetical protein